LSKKGNKTRSPKRNAQISQVVRNQLGLSREDIRQMAEAYVEGIVTKRVDAMDNEGILRALAMEALEREFKDHDAILDYLRQEMRGALSEAIGDLIQSRFIVEVKITPRPEEDCQAGSVPEPEEAVPAGDVDDSVIS